ncbi:hexapeptide repeat-containing transferase [Rhizobium freirei PRF 81]|uniref:Hexapeptide repeat-containing transferase n=1 Tax=Rhizobium freirei PRF 81 TaxID=363754 RepID=N6UR79_9HYPH|nr:acetyltransferase [Rhizobium freirei]ENN84230.1 hexapeptide repeat-containing transferase [Rhizobium freirei PRF 81]
MTGISKDKESLLIVGNGEIASMAYEYFLHDSSYEPVGFAIGSDYINGDTFEGLPLVDLATVEEHFPPAKTKAFVAIGDSQLNRVRARHYVNMKARGYTLASYVSSRAFVWHNVKIGDNCFVLEDNTIQAFVTIGNNVILWSGNHIGHRSTVEDNVFITSHVVVSGFCNIGKYSYIGVNAAIGNNTDVAEDNYIAMSASIASSTSPNTIYQGNPAEPRKIAATRFCRVRDE